MEVAVADMGDVRNAGFVDAACVQAASREDNKRITTVHFFIFCASYGLFFLPTIFERNAVIQNEIVLTGAMDTFLDMG